MTDINQSTVLITGATGGFGRHMVSQFGASGGRLLLTDVDAGALATLADEARAAGNEVIDAMPADLSRDSGSRSLHRWLGELGIVPDILVNNAGLGVAGRHDHVPADRWEGLLQVNLLAPMRLCHLFLPAMIKRGSGHVVNVSSLAGWVGSPGLSAYCASKFGLRGFAEALRYDLRDAGIRVSTVYPSFSRTPILDSEQFGYDERRRVPDHMVTDPADVVAAIVRGVRRNRPHIFPDRVALTTHYLQRFLPGVIPLLQSRLDRVTQPA
ncbi:MAG: SDR family NAD(P)-dependent oxidoreductase [Gammaproteobacteria bacterium]|nr:SDR family NAD(P)-dependent oxidoreductase [Gammaproteobacteria bacterium]MDH4253204.1 SDR family NAD(P)-dependent oxidoreductase [Gammaproteobacteria bacterium]MDH5309017.1 SDR family NAD(P)-dependent oxidoreductase [Gammaproteobacteria bacterium]